MSKHHAGVAYFRQLTAAYFPPRLFAASMAPLANTASAQMDIGRVTVAAFDESFSTSRPNLTYMVVVCSTPDYEKRAALQSASLPLPEVAIKAPERHGLVILGMALPPWHNGYERTTWWKIGLQYGILVANRRLQEQRKPPVGLVFVDGRKPDDFGGLKSKNSPVSVVFAEKFGSNTKHYATDVDPLGVSLLLLADRVVGQMRRKMDRTRNLEAITAALSQSRKPLAAFAPSFPSHKARAYLCSRL